MEFALEVLFLIEQLLQSVSQYYVCIIEAAVLFVELVVLIIVLGAL